jgi:hypothetical protein
VGTSKVYQHNCKPSASLNPCDDEKMEASSFLMLFVWAVSDILKFLLIKSNNGLTLRFEFAPNVQQNYKQHILTTLSNICF